MGRTLNPVFSHDLIKEIRKELEWNLNNGSAVKMILTEDDDQVIAKTLIELWHHLKAERDTAVIDLFRSPDSGDICTCKNCGCGSPTNVREER